MKKVLTLATVCLFVLALCSCGSTDTPEGVTTKAIKCLIDKDYDGYVDMMYFKKEKSNEDMKQIVALVKDKMDKELEQKQGIKDFKVDRTLEREGTFVRIGDGTIDFKAVRRAIERVGYSGWVSIESSGWTDAEHSAIMDRFFAGTL